MRSDIPEEYPTHFELEPLGSISYGRQEDEQRRGKRV